MPGHLYPIRHTPLAPSDVCMKSFTLSFLSPTSLVSSFGLLNPAGSVMLKRPGFEVNGFSFRRVAGDIWATWRCPARFPVAGLNAITPAAIRLMIFENSMKRLRLVEEK